MTAAGWSALAGLCGLLTLACAFRVAFALGRISGLKAALALIAEEEAALTDAPRT